MSSPDEAWSALLELNPQLGQGRLFLRRCSAGNQCGAAELDHRGWTVRLSFGQGLLRVALQPAEGGEVVEMAVHVGDGVDVAGDALRACDDHLSVSPVGRRGGRRGGREDRGRGVA